MQNPSIILVTRIISLLCLVICSCSDSASNGIIKGHVLLPNEIDMATVPKEAKGYIYLKDYTPGENSKGITLDSME